MYTWSTNPLIWAKLVGYVSAVFFEINLSTCMNQSINPATVAIFSYFVIVYSIVLDLTLFDIKMTNMQYLGASICLIFSFASAIYKRKYPS